MSDERTERRLSIGAVARATGIPAATLRTWERRYEFPRPARNEAGHRIYHPDIVDRLRLTNRAVDAGYRPSNVVGLSEDELRELLDAADLAESAPDGAEQVGSEEIGVDLEYEWLDEWLAASRALDGDTLDRNFRDEWNRLGGLDFLRRRAAPFLEAVGEAWAAGDLNVVHEHYSSELLRDFLTGKWRPRSRRATGPAVVLATPDGELHAIGLHLVAVVFAMAGWQVVLLGPNTPVDEVLEACTAEKTDAVAISVSRSFAEERATAYFTELRERLPDEVAFLGGGGGAPAIEEGPKQFASLESLYDWAFERAD